MIPDYVFCLSVAQGERRKMRHFARVWRFTLSTSALELARHHRDAARRWDARAKGGAQ